MYDKLVDIFRSVTVKYLRAVDVKSFNSKSKGSNQHEIGGLVKAGFSEFLGLSSDGKVEYSKATMVYIIYSATQVADLITLKEFLKELKGIEYI